MAVPLPSALGYTSGPQDPGRKRELTRWKDKMLKLLKTLLLSLLGLLTLLVIAIVAAFLLIDPSRYRPALESAFASQTGLQLSIAGGMSWSFRPVFGLSVSDLRLRNPGSPMELASLAQLTLKLEPRALLDGRLALQEFLMDGLHVNWMVDEAGRSNWHSDAATPTSPAGAAPSAAVARDTEGSLVDASTIAQISVRNASVAVQDRARGISSRLDNVTFSSQNANLRNRPFPLALSFSVADEDAAREAVFGVSAQAHINLEAGDARFDELLLKLNPLQLSGAITLENFHATPQWRGSLESNVFPLQDFLDLYVRSDAPSAATDLLPADFNPDSDRFSLGVDFAGTAQQMEIAALRLALDAMRLEATGSWTAAQAGRNALLRYTLTGNALDLNRFTQVTASAEGLDAETATDVATAVSQTVTASPERELPIQLLQSLDVEGSHAIESLAVGGLQLNDINAQLSVRSGLLNLSLRPAGLYGGQLTATTAFDTRQTPPLLTSIVSVQNLDIAQLAQAVPAAAFAQGRLNLESFHTLRGRTNSQLLDSLNGSTSFSVADNAIDIGIVKQVFSAISVLSPAGSGDLAQQWPDVVRFGTVEGSLSFTQGLAQNQQFTLQLDNFEITATGGLDLARESFDYAALLTVYGEPAPQTIPVAPLYQGIGWPVQCSARFDAQYSQYCGPDFARVRELFVAIGRDQVERRVQDAISDQMPAELQDATRSLLDRILR